MVKKYIYECDKCKKHWELEGKKIVQSKLTVEDPKVIPVKETVIAIHDYPEIRLDLCFQCGRELLVYLNEFLGLNLGNL